MKIDLCPILAHRLAQWAVISSGGMPTDSCSSVRSGDYIDGCAAVSYSGEWPEPALQIDRVMVQIIGQYGEYGRQMKDAMRAYHASDFVIEHKAKQCRMSKRTFWRRLKHGHDLVGRILPGIENSQRKKVLDSGTKTGTFGAG